MVLWVVRKRRKKVAKKSDKGTVDLSKLSSEDIAKLNQSENYFSYVQTWHYLRFLKMPFKIIGLFCGNQSTKTSASMYQYVVRILGHHPVPKKNVVYFECSERSATNLSPHGFKQFRADGVVVPGWEKGTYNIKTLPKDGKCTECGAPIVIHQRKSRKIRMCAETLPGDKQSANSDGTQSVETKNTVYPEFKYWLPPFMIKRDITFRNPAMLLYDPLAGMELNGTVNRGDDIVVDFMSYAQTVQAGAGVQRISIYIDEEPPKDFWDEQLVRLLREDGDIILGLTPAQGMSWTYDEIFERAQLYYRTQTVVDFLNTNEKDRHYHTTEVTDSDQPIGVLQSATDDNPTLSPESITELFKSIDDPDVLATRRYGIHKQVSGRIFKRFDYRTHYIDFSDYFQDGIFESYNHFLMIDYHPHNRWACSWMSLSPYNEAFVWREFSPDPEKMVTRTIANEIALLSRGFKFRLNLIDALAEQTQTNTNTSTLDDLNEVFLELYREGLCSKMFWETWDTKGTRGREVIRERLNNAFSCKRPFNNKIADERGTRYLPTIWISNRCPETAKSLRQWRLESWSRSYQNVDKDRKETPAQKWSHYCTALEAVFKDARCKPPRIKPPRPAKRAPKYFNRRAYN